MTFEELRERIIELINQNGNDVTRSFLGDVGSSSWGMDQGLPNILMGLVIMINRENEQLREENVRLRAKINEIITAWNGAGIGPYIEPLLG